MSFIKAIWTGLKMRWQRLMEEDECDCEICKPKKGGKVMTINKFIQEVILEEGKAKSVDIAQGKEVLSIIRKKIKKHTGVDIYEIIKTIKED